MRSGVRSVSGVLSVKDSTRTSVEFAAVETHSLSLCALNSELSEASRYRVLSLSLSLSLSLGRSLCSGITSVA